MSESIYEKIVCDSIDKPIDIFNKNIFQNNKLPFRVQSGGYYNEGKNFSSFHYGFDNFTFVITVGGKGRLTYHDKTKVLCKGDMAYVSNKDVVLYEAEEGGWMIAFANINGVCCDYYERMWNEGGYCVIKTENIEKYDTLIGNIIGNINKPYLSNELLISMYLSEILTSALCERESQEQELQTKVYPEWVIKVIDYIESNYASDIKIEELASIFFLNKTYFSRRFKYYTGKSPKEYQLECRLEKATLLLRVSTYDIVDIAGRCGFTSHSQFSKMFKQLFGETPSEYRKARN